MADLFELYNQEQELLRRMRAKDPELVTPRRPFSPEQILQHVGIRVSFGPQPTGYLKLYHQDFIVEEVDREGRVSTIEPEPETPVPPPAGAPERILHADLVKVGLSTLEACRGVATAFGLQAEQVGYGGLKDKVAITSQRISVNGLDPSQTATPVHIPGLLLKHRRWAKGVVGRGSHAANRFTLVIRSTSTIEESWLSAALERWSRGFYNFFHLQRFGTPRLIGHVLGKLVLRGEYREAIRFLLADRGVQDIPLVNQARDAAEQHFGDWRRLREVFSVLPYTFRLELQVVDYLAEHPDDYLGVLRRVPGLTDQVRLWIQSYGSYLFNGHLSELVAAGQEMPSTLPYLLHPQFQRVPAYVHQLAVDGIRQPHQAAAFLLGRGIISSRGVGRTVVPVTVHHARSLGKTALLNFDLPTGAYATTFLMHFFALPQELPNTLPAGSLDLQRYDSKALLGTGSVAAVEQVLGPYIPSPDWVIDALVS